MATAHTAHCRHRACAMSLESRCSCVAHGSNASRAFWRSAYQLGYIMMGTARLLLICSMTQLDIWLARRDNARMLWRDPHAGDFHHHGLSQRDSSHNLGLGQSFKFQLWRMLGASKTGLSMCPPPTRSRPLPKTPNRELHPGLFRNKNQRCQHFKVRITTDSFSRDG